MLHVKKYCLVCIQRNVYYIYLCGYLISPLGNENKKSAFVKSLWHRSIALGRGKFFKQFILCVGLYNKMVDGLLKTGILKGYISYKLYIYIKI